MIYHSEREVIQMRATLSLRGLYSADPSIFDGLNLPPDITARWRDYESGEAVEVTYSLNREAIINSILDEAAELEVLYSSPDAMKAAIGHWSDIHADLWRRIWSDLCTHYFFQYNKDGYSERIHRYDSLTDTEKYGTGDDAWKTVNSGSFTPGKSTTVNSGYGFNSENAVPTAQTVESGEKETNESSTTQSGSRSNTRTGSEIETFHDYGNIGVTMSSQILRDEIETRMNFELSNMIKDQFIGRFCILIY